MSRCNICTRHYQAELAQKLASEHQENTGAAVILGSIDGQEELAGDPEHLKSPGIHCNTLQLTLPWICHSFL